MPGTGTDERTRARSAPPLTISDARWIFLAAFAVRVIYLALVYRGPGSLRVDDSPIYEGLAAQIVEGCRTLSCAMTVSTSRMPLYPMFLASLRSLIGSAPIWPVLVQMLIDCGSCVLVGWLAGLFDRRLALPAGLIACVNLNLITSGGLILTESLFMPPFIGSLIAVVLYIEAPSARRALAAGLLVGLALLVRSVLMFFLPILLVALALAAWRRRVPVARAVRDLVLAAAATIALVSPILAHNLNTYGRPALVDQGGPHALLWVAPTAFEFARGVPFEEGQRQMKQRLADALAAQHPAALPSNPFAAADFEERVARAALLELGLGGLAHAWLDGSAINLATPALVAVPPISRLERPHFYATPGAGIIDKLANIARRGAGSLFFWLMVPATAATLLCRAIELWALVRIGRAGGLALGPASYLVAVALYFVLITGPVTGVKYRLELEPFLTLLLASGGAELYRRLRGARTS